MRDTDPRHEAAVPLPDVDSPPPEEVLENLPSTQEIIEHADSAEQILEQQPSVEELVPDRSGADLAR